MILISPGWKPAGQIACTFKQFADDKVISASFTAWAPTCDGIVSFLSLVLFIPYGLGLKLTSVLCFSQMHELSSTFPDKPTCVFQSSRNHFLVFFLAPVTGFTRVLLLRRISLNRMLSIPNAQYTENSLYRMLSIPNSR